MKAFQLEDPKIFIWAASFGLSYAVGLVVPGAPGGLGVFEATMLLYFGDSLEEASLLAMVLSYRVVSTLSDLLAAFSIVADQALLQRMRQML